MRGGDHVKIRHYVAEDTNILSIQFREDIEPDYGTEIAPGVTLHYTGERGKEEITPVFLEIEATPSRPLDDVEFKRLNERGERMDEPDIVEIVNMWLALSPEARRSIGTEIRRESKTTR